MQGVAGGVKVTTPPAVTGIPTTITDQRKCTLSHVRESGFQNRGNLMAL